MLRMGKELEIAHVLSICKTLSSVASCCLAPPKYYVKGDLEKKKYTVSLNSCHSNVQSCPTQEFEWTCSSIQAYVVQAQH